MRLAEKAGLEAPLHGLVFSKGGAMTYFVKRFDPVGRKEKLPVEDFAQLMGFAWETKYDAPMEKVASVIETFCTFPAIEKIKLFRVTLVNFLLGNENMHLKNFSLITRHEKVELSPVYDIVNTTLALGRPGEEIALPLMGKRRKLDLSVLVDYFGHERLGIKDGMIRRVLREMERAISAWPALIGRSFLSPELNGKYQDLVNERAGRVCTG